MDDLKNLQKLLQQGKFSEVEAKASAALESYNINCTETEIPSTTNQALIVQTQYLLAVCFRLQKKFSQAIRVLQSLLAINNNHARAHQELAYNYRDSQNLQLASIHFYKASQLNPALLSAWQALEKTYKQANQYEALDLCQQQIAHLSALPKPLLAATDLLYEGNIAGADTTCRAYLQQHKHSLPGLLLLAEIANKLKAIGESEFILETCVELHNDSNEAKYALFKIYSKLGKFEKALTLAKTLSKQAPNNAFYAIAVATALVGVGEIKKAISTYQQILSQHKANANVYLLLGHALKTQGNFLESVKAYQSAYTLSPFFGDAYWSLANTKTYRFSEREIKDMLEGVTGNGVSDTDKIHLHFALGKAYEDTKDYAASFEHYEKGNKLQSLNLSYSSDKHSSLVDDQIKAFTPSLIEKLKNTGDPSTSPIFIVGLPRAGSTLLEQILASHSQVDGTMELHEIMGLAAKLSKQQGSKPSYPFNLSTIPHDYFKKFGEQFIKDTHIYRRGAAYFIDKMPNNYMHVGLIKLILPNAKIIDARREAMSCCFSGYKQLFGEGQEFSYSLHSMGRYYANYLRLMDHWQGVFPDQILLVQHEDVVNDTEAQIRRILSFCGLDFEQSCVDFYQSKRAVKTPSAQQVRQPIYASGLHQWKHYEPYLDELKQALRESN